jgi:hypothetical protein
VLENRIGCLSKNNKYTTFKQQAKRFFGIHDGLEVGQKPPIEALRITIG